MSQKQQSLAASASGTSATDSDSITTPEAIQATSNIDEDADPRLELGEIYNLIQQQDRVSFLGLEEHSDAEYPEHISKASPMHDENPVAFTDIIKLLPEAEEGELKAVNDFVNPDGTVDAEAIEAVDDIDLDELSIDPDEIENADQHNDIHKYKDIVDPRRKALHALGGDIKYRWQIASDQYAIINPKDAYYPAYKTFKEKGSSETIFGWVDTKDWGGQVDIYIFFADHTIDRPEADDDDAPLYVGLHTGYDFSGGRAMDVKLFGYDPDNDVRFYSLGARRSRRHIGDPNNPDHERQQGRTPIKEWWEKEHENLILWTDDLIDDIGLATATTIDFTNFRFDVEDFYSYLDIPDSYIENTDGGIGAVKRARRHSPADNEFTMWTLFYTLAATLEEEFQGSDHAGSAFKVYADIATNILRSPRTVIERAKREHDAQQQAEGQQESKRDKILNGTVPLDEIDDITELDGVSTEDELGLMQKRDLAENSQKKLFNFD